MWRVGKNVAQHCPSLVLQSALRHGRTGPVAARIMRAQEQGTNTNRVLSASARWPTLSSRLQAVREPAPTVGTGASTSDGVSCALAMAPPPWADSTSVKCFLPVAPQV